MQHWIYIDVALYHSYAGIIHAFVLLFPSMDSLEIYINTTVTKETRIELWRNGECIAEYTQEEKASDFLLREISGLLRSKGYSKRDITGVRVHTGPGSFTGTRIGVAVANALSYALGVSVNKQEPPVLPCYTSEPSITINPAVHTKFLQMK